MSTPVETHDTHQATGRLILAATPIGNPHDASPRLARMIAEADVVAAEDTRRLRRLASDLQVKPRGRVVSHHEHNEGESAADLVKAALAGKTVLVLTDAGTPSVSDPGYRIAQAAIIAGVPVASVPGPSAALAALSVAGLPTDRFCFEGFLPRRAGERLRALEGLAGERRTMVFFEAPHRTAATLAAMAQTFGDDRPGAVCRELTKTYEQVVRGPIGELAGWAHSRQVLGEVTLVVGGLERDPATVQDLLPRVRDLVESGTKLRAASKQVAADHDVSAKALYDAAVAQRHDRDD